MNRTFTLVTRLSYKDVHYGGGVIAGATLLELFGDAVTGLSAVTDCDESLLQEWTSVNFKGKAHPGDFIKITAELVEVKRIRRKVSVAAYKIISSLNESSSDVRVASAPELLANATGVVVIPFSKAKKGRGA